MPIKTNVPGMEVCELFPRHAKIADKYNIIRSIHHGFADAVAVTNVFSPAANRPRPRAH